MNDHNNNNNAILISQPQQIMKLVGYNVINNDINNQMVSMVPLYKLETVQVPNVYCFNTTNNITVNNSYQNSQISSSVPNILLSNNANGNPKSANQHSISNVGCTQIRNPIPTLTSSTSTNSVTMIPSSVSSSATSSPISHIQIRDMSRVPITGITASHSISNISNEAIMNSHSMVPEAPPNEVCCSYKCDICNKLFKHECKLVLFHYIFSIFFFHTFLHFVS